MLLNDLIGFVFSLLGSEESRSAKVQKQEQYKRELQQQMQEQADIKKRYSLPFHSQKRAC